MDDRPNTGRSQGELVPDPQEIQRALTLLVDPNYWVELRAIDLDGRARSFFSRGDDIAALTSAATRLSKTARGVYVTLNPVAESAAQRAGGATRDADIIHRQWLLIDIDRAGDTKASATEAEKALCDAVADNVAEYLRSRRFGDPICVDSGNGRHLLYALDRWPNDATSKETIQAFFAALGTRFDTSDARIDRSVFNAARISKLPGTPTRKGAPTSERPHRLARVLHAPDEMVRLTRELVARVTKDLTDQCRAGSSTHQDGGAARFSGTASGAGDLRPGDDFDQRGDWERDILAPAGWKYDHTNAEGVRYYTRPGKDRGVSASVGHCHKSGAEALYVFSDQAAPLQPNTAYSKFQAFATLYHGGDFSAAAKALAAKGYGRHQGDTGRHESPPALDIDALVVRARADAAAFLNDTATMTALARLKMSDTDYGLFAQIRDRLTSEAGIKSLDLRECVRRAEEKLRTKQAEAARVAFAERLKAAESAAPDEPPNVADDLPACTELANSRRLVDWYGRDLRHCEQWGKWLTWDGSRWLESPAAAQELAKAAACRFYSQAKRSGDSALEEWAVDSMSAGNISSTLRLASSDPRVAVRADDLDRDPFLLACPNGTIDLRTGELREHRREDLISRLCPVAFEETANCPLWEKTVLSIMGGDPNLAAYLRRLLGHCLTGSTREQILPIFWGRGSNGKSLLVTTLLRILGRDLAGPAPRDLLKGDDLGHPTALASLYRKRLVVLSESAEACRLPEALMKSLVSIDLIQARRMHEDFWAFEPTHKVIICTNHHPRIKGTDSGIWRRIRLIPFSVRFWNDGRGESGPPELRADPSLEDKLAAEYPGILNWLIAGCLDWQRHGMQDPPEVLAATADYRKEQDYLGRFLDDCCVLGEGFTVRQKDLYNRYRHWAQGNGESKPLTATAFGIKMAERPGITKIRSNGTVYRGLMLRVASGRFVG